MSRLVGQRLISAPPALVWMGLHDIGVMHRSNAACESMERLDETHVRAVFVLKAGPVTGRFHYRFQFEDLKPPHSYTVRFEADGGISGYREGVIRVRLEPERGGTRLHYEVEATTRGRIAELAGNEMDAAAARLIESLAAGFEQNLGALAGASRERETAPASGPLHAGPADAVSLSDRPDRWKRRAWRWLLVGAGVIAIIIWATITGDAPNKGEPDG
ncbi:MAG: carbon monoxide dehydrogenase subunit G [Burkholderiaceae bacterium]